MILRRIALIDLVLALALLLQGCALAPADTNSGVQRLYVLDCGQGVAGDISRWSPGVNVGQTREFVDSCYLVKHARGWMLWDTGVADAVAAMPQGLAPSDPRAVHWKKPRTLAAQLAEIGVRPADVRYVGVSHSHADHIGNVPMFPNSMLLVQRAEYDWPQDSGPRFPAGIPVTKLEGDRDVFGDGSVVLLATPGHTPGHQSLLVRLPRTGNVLLSGDAVHFRENWEARRVPSMNFDQARSSAAMQRIADTLAREKAVLWINHDKPQRDLQRMSPAFYE